MDGQALVIGFSAPPLVASDTFVLLEQEPLAPYTNYLTKAGVLKFLGSRVTGTTPTAGTSCGGQEGGYTGTLYAYPYPSTLAYRLGLSHGSLGERALEVVTFSEDLQCDLETELRPKYPVLDIVGYMWIGEAYDSGGNVVDPPAVTVTAAGLSTEAPVYGTLLITYTVLQHRTQVVIPPRNGAAENRLQSFAWAVWSGGTAMLEMEAPDGAEEGICQDSPYGSTHIERQSSAPDYVDSENETHHIDYCTMECTDCDE